LRLFLRGVWFIHHVSDSGIRLFLGSSIRGVVFLMMGGGEGGLRDGWMDGCVLRFLLGH